jgi:hypothetical protein
LKQNP